MHLYRHSVYDISINVPARLRYEVRRLFDNSGHTLFTPGRRSGSLNVRSLHRGDDRLFQRRDDVDGIDSAVSILIDRSGSMCGALGDACSVAYALADSLINAEVQVQLITFGSSASVALPWTTNRSKVRDVLSRVGSGGGTNDRGAVRLALESLLARPERRRVIFVLTDGRGFIDDVRGLCQSAKALGVTVIGVGIGCSVSDIYSQAITIRNISQLGEAVFTQIKLAA
jgi:cobalamin biosynthesis protein CobT